MGTVTMTGHYVGTTYKLAAVIASRNAVIGQVVP